MSTMNDMNREIEGIIESAGLAERLGFPTIAKSLYTRAADKQLQVGMLVKTPTARGAICQLALVWLKKGGDYPRALRIARELSLDESLPDPLRSGFESMVKSLESYEW